MNLILFSFVLATTAITLAFSANIDKSATCTYTCNSDGSCSHKTDLTSRYHYSMRSGTCVSPNYSCLNGICCKGQTEKCGQCLDKCRGKVGKLVTEDGQIKSDGLRSNNQQTTRQVNKYNYSPFRGRFLHFVINHSSEIKSLSLMKCPSKMLQNLPYFICTKTQSCFFRFSFRATLYFPLNSPMLS